MLGSDSTPAETIPRLRRTAVSPGVVFAMAAPPAPRAESAWPNWLAPVGASWKRPTSSRSPPENRSE